MIEILNINETEKWDGYVKSFTNFDVQYLCAYAKALRNFGDGEPHLIFFANNELRLCYTVLQPPDSNVWITPYYYGGPMLNTGILNKNILGKNLEQFSCELEEILKCQKVFDHFVIFNPFLHDSNIFQNIFETDYMCDTVYMDTSSSETIFNNMTRECRNRIRKATKNGVEIKICPISDYPLFMPLYLASIAKNNAYDYHWNFNENFFRDLYELQDNCRLFLAYANGRPVSGALMLFSNYVMHYYCGGTDYAYKHLYPNELLFYNAGLFCSKRNIKFLNLGPGTYVDENDSLLQFKKKFNPHGRFPLFQGKFKKQ